MDAFKKFFVFMAYVHTFLGVEMLLISSIARQSPGDAAIYGILSFVVGISCFIIFTKIDRK